MTKAAAAAEAQAVVAQVTQAVMRDVLTDLEQRPATSDTDVQLRIKDAYDRLRWVPKAS